MRIAMMLILPGRQAKFGKSEIGEWDAFNQQNGATGISGITPNRKCRGNGKIVANDPKRSIATASAKC